MHKKTVLLLCLSFFTIGSFLCHGNNEPWFLLTPQNETAYKSHWAHDLAMLRMENVHRSHRTVQIVGNTPCTQPNISLPQNNQALQTNQPHKGPTEQQMLQAVNKKVSYMDTTGPLRNDIELKWSNRHQKYLPMQMDLDQESAKLKNNPGDHKKWLENQINDTQDKLDHSYWWDRRSLKDERDYFVKLYQIACNLEQQKVVNSDQLISKNNSELDSVDVNNINNTQGNSNQEQGNPLHCLGQDDLFVDCEMENINFENDENGNCYVTFSPGLEQEEKKSNINFSVSINLDTLRNYNNKTENNKLDNNNFDSLDVVPTIKDNTKHVLEHNKIDVKKYMYFNGNQFQKEIVSRVIDNFNMSANLRKEFENNAVVVDACDATMHFSDAGFDAAMKGDAKEAIAYTSLSETMLGFAAVKAGLITLEFVKDIANEASQVGLKVTDNFGRIVLGGVVGTGKAVVNVAKGLGQLIVHPQQTIFEMECKLNQLDYYLGRLMRQEPTTVQAVKDYSQEFLKLPLEKQVEIITELGMSFYLPGKIISGASSLASHPSVVRAFTSLGRFVVEESPILKAALVAELRWNIESTQLVGFGGRIMSRDLMDQLVRWGNANKWIFSDVELVEFAEAFLPISHACTKAAREFVIQDNISACLIESNLKLPQGVSHETFAQIAKLINEKVGHISTDIYVHGSRAKGTGPISDIDFAIRVTPGKFEELLDICFGKPNYPSAKWKTWYHALNGGKIRSSDMTLHKGGINLSHFRTELERILGFDVDISIIKQGGSFDRGPLIYL